MLIDTKAPSETLETVSKAISELKQKMEFPGPKRRRFTSQTSQTSTNTQITNLSDDSTQPTSPTEGKFYGQGTPGRPVFNLGSQDEDQQSINSYSLFGNGAKTNRANLDVSEARRIHQMKAKGMRAGRRQSESSVGNNVSESMCPHHCHTTMCMSHMSMQEEVGEDATEIFTRTNSNNNVMAGFHNFGNSMQSGICRQGICGSRNSCNNFQLQQSKPRANSEDIRVSHEYEIPDALRKKDTVVQLEKDRLRTRTTRKRPISVSSDTPSETSRNRPRAQYDNDPGYVRTEGVQTDGFCEALKFYLNKNGFIVLLVLNILLLFVNFAGLPYLAVRVLQDVEIRPVPPQREPNCFNCRDMPFATKDECLRDGIIDKVDKHQCCFKSVEKMTSWFVKQVTNRAKDRPFIYLTGNDNHHHKRTPKERIQWKDRATGPMEVAENRTLVKVLEKGYYFIFSRVHYSGGAAKLGSSFPTISHHVKKYTDLNKRPVTLETISQKCNVNENSTAIEHNSVIETIVYLRENEHIYIDIEMRTLVGYIKNYTLGLFKVN